MSSNNRSSFIRSLSTVNIANRSMASDGRLAVGEGSGLCVRGRALNDDDYIVKDILGSLVYFRGDLLELYAHKGHTLSGNLIVRLRSMNEKIHVANVNICSLYLAIDHFTTPSLSTNSSVSSTSSVDRMVETFNWLRGLNQEVFEQEVQAMALKQQQQDKCAQYDIDSQIVKSEKDIDMFSRLDRLEENEEYFPVVASSSSSSSSVSVHIPNPKPDRELSTPASIRVFHGMAGSGHHSIRSTGGVSENSAVSTHLQRKSATRSYSCHSLR